MEEQNLFSTAQVAHIVGVSQVQIIKQINAGRLKARKIGNQYAVSKPDLDEYRATKRSVGRPKMDKSQA